MEVRAQQGTSTPIRIAERRMIDQFNRLNIGAPENGQNSGGSHKYENIANNRKVNHEVQAQNRRVNVNPSTPKVGEEDDKKDLMKPGDMVKSRWKILQKIGGGGFGEIYQAIDTQLEQEKLNRAISNGSELCTSCTMKAGTNLTKHISGVNMTQDDGSNRIQHCSNCGREFFSTTKAGLQRHSSEDALESADSGNSSGYSERGSVVDNNIVAVKTESNTQSKQMLHMEVAVMRKLKGKKNFCELLACGKTHRINYIVMTLQGKNLSELRKKAVNRSFGRSTSLRIICKCLDALQELHNVGYLHRDIKPSNFCLRREDPTEICLLDFGLVRPYTKPGTTNQIRPPRPTAGFRGTVRYASLNAHNYRELGRHDDLWSMYYMLVEFLSGQLPWHRRSEKDVVKKIKSETRPIELGVSAGLPQSIAATWVNHLNSLNYFATPNYRELRHVIELWLSANGIEWSELYDWQRQAMTRAESATTFTPMFKRNQPSGRQFVQNTKRPAHHESAGCLKRLDKRGYGSSADLKRTESEGGGGTGEHGRSTVALCEDAVTNKNAATEKIMQDDGNENFEDASEKLDPKDKIMGSHIDLAAIAGEKRKPTENADKQFLTMSKVLVRPTIEATMEFQTEPSFTSQLYGSPSAQIFSPRSPPPVPPHRRINHHDNDLVFLQPENRPLVPPSYPTTLPPIPCKSQPENVQRRNDRLPPALRCYKGLSDVLFMKSDTPATVNNLQLESTLLPTPKPRNRYPENEENQVQVGGEDDQAGWLCRDDIKGVYKPSVLISPYVQRCSMQTQSNYGLSGRYNTQNRLPFTKCSSAEHLETSAIAEEVQKREIEGLQQYRSMTTLHFNSPEFPRTIVKSNTWLPIYNEQTSLSNLGGVLSLSSGNIQQGVIKRPTYQGFDIKSSLTWRPMKFGPWAYVNEVDQLGKEEGIFNL